MNLSSLIDRLSSDQLIGCSAFIMGIVFTIPRAKFFPNPFLTSLVIVNNAGMYVLISSILSSLIPSRFKFILTLSSLALTTYSLLLLKNGLIMPTPSFFRFTFKY